MSRFTEEDIFKYLDRTLSQEEEAHFETQLENDPDLKLKVEEFRRAHDYISTNALESAPDGLTDKVMIEVAKKSNKNYYRPSGLFSNTSFLLVSGVLTAMIALTSILQTGSYDMQGMLPDVSEISYLKDWSLEGLVTKRALTNSFMVICGVLALALLDRFVLNPFFRKESKNLEFN
jgi:hypothetical protein